MELAPSELEQLEQIRAADIRIPPRSRVLQNMEKALQDDNTTERMVGQMIARDASLIAEVFKLVNSSFFHPGTKIDSLEQAVCLLGRKPMGEIARSAILRHQLGGGDPRMEKFWARCTDVAMICSMLSYDLDAPNALTTEQAYLVGMFHDCGAAVLAQQVKGYGDVALTAAAIADFVTEDKEKGTSHCIAGLLIAQEWELPPIVCEAIRSHHHLIAPEQPAAQAIAVLQLARHIYAMSQSWRELEWNDQAERVMATLDFPQARLEGIIDKAIGAIEMVP